MISKYTQWVIPNNFFDRFKKKFHSWILEFPLDEKKLKNAFWRCGNCISGARRWPEMRSISLAAEKINSKKKFPFWTASELLWLELKLKKSKMEITENVGRKWDRFFSHRKSILIILASRYNTKARFEFNFVHKGFTHQCTRTWAWNVCQ